MAFPLNKAPRGILELLRLRTLGKNPQFFSETAVGGLDVTEYYGADLLVASNVTSGAVAINGNTTDTYTVPARCHFCSGLLIVGAAAGTQVRMWLSLFPPGSTVNVGIAETVITAPVVGAQYQVSGRFPKPLVCLPGTTFRFDVEGNAAGADHQRFLRTYFEQYTGSP